MVKLARGARRPGGGHPGRPEPVPLFPPGDLPVFGPPRVNMRRGPLPPPRPLGHLPPPGAGFPPLGRPHIPPPPPPHHMGRPPMHHHHPHMPPYPAIHRRPGPPPPPPPLALRPLLQTPILPPRPIPFMRGVGRGPIHMGRGPGGPIKRLAKNVKKSKNKKNKVKEAQKSDGNSKKNENPGNNGLSIDVIDGPWISDIIKAEIEKMNSLKKEAEEKKAQTDWDLYNEQKKKVESMSNAAKMEYIGSQPDGGEHYCDVCDKAWNSPEELAKHIENHVTCGIDDCTFTAHAKVVQAHVKLQHATGLFEKIVRTSDKEDIEKWIAERKRRFPTKENIELSNAKKVEMEERGERLLDNQKVGKKRLGKGFSRTKKQLSKGKKKKKKLNEKIQYLPIYEDSSASDDNSSLCGPDNIVHENSHVINSSNNCGDDSDNKFSDEEWKLTESQEVEKPLGSALTALIMTYNTDESLSEGEIEDGRRRSNEGHGNSNLIHHGSESCNVVQCDIASDPMDATDDAPPEVIGNKKEIDVPNIHIMCEEKKEKRKKIKRIRQIKKKNQNPQKVHKTNACYSLLEQLLKNEIRHERNYILQCVCYVVKNNFFDN